MDEIAIVAGLATAVEAHDLAGVAVRVGGGLGAGVAWVEAALVTETGEINCAITGVGAGQVALARRGRGEALLATLRGAAVMRLPGPPSVEASPEGKWARRFAARTLLFLPASVRGECIGQVVVALREPWGPPSRQGLEAMARVVSAGLSHIRLLTRVATLSRRAYRENRHLRADLQQVASPPRLIGGAPALRQAVAGAEAVAPFDTPVLVRGETGTGKELLAHHLHERSGRARRPFLKLNCGAIPDGLVEAELFGHERGAFTGAVRRHEGVFERASGGSVLLDEIGELPLGSQVKILRVLQSGDYQRVGGTEALRADVRIIAATHRDLDQMVAAGTFRADLFYRLNVFPIEVPPLRERLEDIPLLTASLVQRLAARLGRETPALDARAIARLEAYPWPGNVRELENVLERALILSPGAKLVIPELQATAAVRRLPERRESLAAVMRRHIELTLDSCQGQIYGVDGAAARLGMPPSTLQSKMARLGVRTPSRSSAR